MSARRGGASPKMSNCFPFPWRVFFSLLLYVTHPDIRMTCGCFAEEREALMDIRASLTLSNITAPPSWGRGDDCCSWERVKCSSNTRRVSHLYFSSLYEYDDYTKVPTGGDTPWRLNISIFSAFTDLQFLDLSSIWYLDLGSNGLAGLKLPKLQHLNLSSNWLRESISLAPLGELVLLKS
ncbi:hypothetical protein GUJ93_ZPchr0458g22614 [Zizania palustris]|uniref:Leucine-rich repeat-containing N-terminal plant-type domain-containing protein n=1 Tax=Zizania palustris TaxID=103762 RepID=A0A8J5UUR8_ZIZPA|nr:hypothetical protein GUJ93_ZPchr0458g22614 [Zizania palustris]